MYARIIQAPLLPGITTEATVVFRDSIGPALKQQPGFANSRALFNQETNNTDSFRQTQTTRYQNQNIRLTFSYKMDKKDIESPWIGQAESSE